MGSLTRYAQAQRQVALAIGEPLASDLDLFLKMKDGIIRPQSVYKAEFEGLSMEDNLEKAAEIRKRSGHDIYAYFENVIDERTAKRISDSLGTATELKSQKNYAGHRLAPWLAHVMVSRQEFARPLLTPGEVMQLPAPDQLLLVSGLPPVRARKLRYYEDRNFTRRHRPPPALSRHGYHDLPAVRGEDWGGRLRKPHPELARSAFSDGNDTPDDNGGLQKQLPLADELQRLSRPVPENEFGRKNEEPDPAADARAVDQSKTSQSLRRAVAISRDDDLMPTL